MQESCSHFPTSKLTTTPYFPISFWLTYILSRRPACLTLLSAVRCSLTSRFPTPAVDPVCAAGRQPVQTKPRGAVSSLCFLEVDLKGWLGRYLLQSEYKDREYMALLKMIIKLEQKNGPGKTTAEQSGRLSFLLLWCLNFLVTYPFSFIFVHRFSICILKHANKTNPFNYL